MNIEIFWKLIRYKLIKDSLFLWKEIRLDIYNKIRKWIYDWDLIDNHKNNIWTWYTKNFIINK